MNGRGLKLQALLEIDMGTIDLLCSTAIYYKPRHFPFGLAQQKEEKKGN